MEMGWGGLGWGGLSTPSASRLLVRWLFELPTQNMDSLPFTFFAE